MWSIHAFVLTFILATEVLLFLSGAPPFRVFKALDAFIHLMTFLIPLALMIERVFAHANVTQTKSTS